MIFKQKIRLFSFILIVFSFSVRSQSPIFSNVPVSDGGFNNNIGSANTSRNIATDAEGNIYVVYANNTEVRIAKSIDEGKSFLPSFLLSLANNAEPEIAVNDNGVVFVAWSNNGTIHFTRSLDKGLTFELPINFGVASSSVHMSTFVSNVYITDRRGRNLYYNNNSGVGLFTEVSTGIRMVYADVLVDQNGKVFLPMDNPGLRLFKSEDAGTTINEINLIPSESVFYSSYALSDGPCGSFIFVGGGGGTSETGFKIDLNTGTPTPIILGRNERTSEGRTLFADNKGTLIDGYRDNNGNLKISISSDQGNSFNNPITVANGGSHNIARNSTSDNLLVVYESNGEIFLSVYNNVIKNVEIAAPNQPLSFCGEASFDLPITLSGVFSPNTLFKATLSNEFGDFSNAIEIGAISTNTDGIIKCSIPAGLASSTNYRIQVESLENCMQSNSVSLTISSVEIDGPSKVCIGEKVQLVSSETPNKVNPWTSSNPAVAVVDSLGLVTSLALGDTEITFNSANTCTDTFNLRVVDFPKINANINLQQCDDDFDGIVAFDTSNLESTLLGNQTDIIVSYFDENNNQLPSPLPNPFFTHSQNIRVRLENNASTSCFTETQVSFTVHEKPTVEVIEEDILCIIDGKEKLTLSVINPDKNLTYEWLNNNNEVIGNAPSLEINSKGMYKVKSISKFGCVSEAKSVLIRESSSSIVTIDNIKVQDDSDNNYIRVDTENLGLGEYEFRLLDFERNVIRDYQEESYFDDLKGNTYILEINDKNNCGSIVIEISLINFPKFFTPNSNGANDYWHIEGKDKNYYKEIVIHIFNRFGKKITSININDKGWDGTLNGRNLPEDDYWYMSYLTNYKGEVLKKTGHFSLIRN